LPVIGWIDGSIDELPLFRPRSEYDWLTTVSEWLSVCPETSLITTHWGFILNLNFTTKMALDCHLLSIRWMNRANSSPLPHPHPLPHKKKKKKQMN